MAVTPNVPAVTGVPLINPVPGVTASPGGNPATDHEVIAAVADESSALSWSLSGVPTIDAVVPGLLTVTSFHSVQETYTEPANPAESVAVMSAR